MVYSCTISHFTCDIYVLCYNQLMKRNLSILIASMAWVAVLAQYYLMIQNSVTSLIESTVRFFSFFTILTNSLVAVFFTFNLVRPDSRYLSVLRQPGALTAVTVYISVVGIIYQFVLRQTWDPTGLQKIVDELLHSVIPVMVIIFWYLYENKPPLTFRLIPQWLIYPLIYLAYILVRGNFSGFYPYPFINVADIGWHNVWINSLMITALFIGISAAFIQIGKSIKV